MASKHTYACFQWQEETSQHSKCICKYTGDGSQAQDATSRLPANPSLHMPQQLPATSGQFSGSSLYSPQQMPTTSGPMPGTYGSHFMTDPSYHHHQANYHLGEPATSGPTSDEFMSGYQSSIASTGSDQQYRTSQTWGGPTTSGQTPNTSRSGLQRQPATSRFSPLPTGGIRRQHATSGSSPNPFVSNFQEPLLRRRDFTESTTPVASSLDLSEAEQLDQDDVKAATAKFRRRARGAFKDFDYNAVFDADPGLSKSTMASNKGPGPLGSQSHDAVSTASVKKKSVAGRTEAMPAQTTTPVAAKKPALAKTGQMTAQKTVQTTAPSETEEGVPWTRVSHKSVKDNATNTRKKELVPAASGRNTGKPKQQASAATGTPAWAHTAIKRPPRPAKTPKELEAEVRRCFDIVKKIPRNAPGYLQAVAAFSEAKDELKKVSEALDIGKNSFPELETPASRLVLPTRTPRLDPILSMVKKAPTVIVDPIDIDISRAASAIARCGPLLSLLAGSWRFVRIKGTVCGKELVDGIFCQEEHPLSWHDLVYSVPLIEHWTNVQTIKGEGYLAHLLKGTRYCDRTKPHHYSDSCGAGMFRLNPYSESEMYHMYKEGQVDEKYYFYFSSGFDFEAERYPAHPAFYLPKGIAIKVSGVTVCRGFDLPDYCPRSKIAMGYAAGLVNKRILDHKEQVAELDRFHDGKKDLNNGRYRQNQVDKVELKFVVECIYGCINLSLLKAGYFSDEAELPTSEMPFWKPLPDCTKKPTGTPAAPPPPPGDAKAVLSVGTARNPAFSGLKVDSSIEEARRHWKTYNADPKLPPSGYFVGSYVWPHSEHWARIDQELDNPKYKSERDVVDKIYADHQAALKEFKKIPLGKRNNELIARMKVLMAKLEATCSPVIKAWPLSKTSKEIELTAQGGRQEERTFECSPNGYFSSHSREMASIVEEVLTLPPIKSNPKQHLLHFSNRILKKQLTATRRTRYKEYLFNRWSSTIKTESIASRISLAAFTLDEAKALGLQTDVDEIHEFLSNIMSEDLKGDNVFQIIDQLFDDLKRYAQMFETQPETHASAFSNSRQVLINVFEEYQKKMSARFNHACTQADRAYVAPSKYTPNVHADAGSIRKLFFHPEFDTFRLLLCSAEFPWFHIHDGIPQLVFPDKAVESLLQSEKIAEASAKK